MRNVEWNGRSPTGDPTTIKKEESAMRPTPGVVWKWSSNNKYARWSFAYNDPKIDAHMLGHFEQFWPFWAICAMLAILGHVAPCHAILALFRHFEPCWPYWAILAIVSNFGPFYAMLANLGNFAQCRPF